MLRAMRQTLAFCTLLLCVGGCGDDTTTAGPDMSAPADLAPAADLAVRVPNGVVCGSMSCAIGQDCCVTVSGTVTSATFIAGGGA